jgi:hypothetical protein
MPAWIRFQFEAGETTLINADQVYFVFKPEEHRIEVFPMTAAPGADNPSKPLCLYVCESPEQVTAAEELILEHAGKGQSLTINLDSLDEHAEYLNNVHGLRMVLQLLHFGRIRIPMENEFDEQDLFDTDNGQQRSEIGQFEDMLSTYLDVPNDSLRRAYRHEKGDLPFEIATDHEECVDHGFHEYWVVKTRPDRHYEFRDRYSDLVKSIVEKEGFDMGQARSS